MIQNTCRSCGKPIMQEKVDKMHPMDHFSYTRYTFTMKIVYINVTFLYIDDA